MTTAFQKKTDLPIEEDPRFHKLMKDYKCKSHHSRRPTIRLQTVFTFIERNR